MKIASVITDDDVGIDAKVTKPPVTWPLDSNAENDIGVSQHPSHGQFLEKNDKYWVNVSFDIKNNKTYL